MRSSKRARQSLAVLLPALGLVLLSSPAFAQSPSAPTPASSAPAQHPLLIMVDAAHGGDDPGALLSPTISEKDVTLAVARRLCQDLVQRSISCQLVRDADVTLSPDQRAETSNSANPTLYIAVHASSMGRGLRIFTAMLPVSQNNNGPFTDWQTAQQGSLARSKSLQDQLVSSIQKMGFPVRALIAPLRPLNNVMSPALAVEVAPTTSDIAQLASANYQDMVSAALANALYGILPSLRGTRSAP
jgi:N-acetylmuramoyl-L-alanine amidase